jgi:hypothetical protein
MITFKVVDHSIRDVQVVEVYKDRNFVASMYPTDHADGVRFLSTHIRGENHTALEEFYFE